ncbi:hypothetical protein OS123_03575 [Corynebacterium sp. P5875]|uniref:ScoMcrA-like SRA domain-containing protein n=1 Tax=Corynebacterium antarcticum TaxID=2800405 RepID=A0A9Q4CB22_9CORY|nr:hypothetical protein [Corynebacterium antarcticum]MCX7537630.1 hypothetical protein [Corynebacterium antarcticum]
MSSVESGFTSGIRWDIEPGEMTTRREVSEVYGGSRLSGISVSGRTPNIILYTDPVQGSKFGYKFDGYDPNDPEVFYYSGEGQVGDQTLSKGNRAIVESGVSGKALRLFCAEGPKRSGGKAQKYIGEFFLDPQFPYRWENVEDIGGGTRSILVFRLRARRSVSLTRHLSPADASLSLEYGVRFVPCERRHISVYHVSEKAAEIAGRREAQLVEEFGLYLLKKWWKICSAEILLPGASRPLRTDLYDQTNDVLYEAKSLGTRENIRMAIGQLLDYHRYLPDPDRVSLAILVPDRPSEDLVELILNTGISLVYKDDEGFRSEGAVSTLF